MSDSYRTEIQAQHEAFDYIIAVLLPQIEEHVRPLLKTVFIRLGGNFKRLYDRLKSLEQNPEKEPKFIAEFHLDRHGVSTLVIINNLWQVARLESQKTQMVDISDWILNLEEPTVYDDSRFDKIYQELFNNDDIIKSSDFKSTSVPALPESSPASCETQITVSITVPTNCAADIIDDLHHLSHQPNFQTVSDFSIVSHTKHSVNDSPEFSYVNSDGFHEDNNVSTIFDDLDREFGLSGFIEEIDALFASCVDNPDPDPDLYEFVSSPDSRQLLPTVVTPDKLSHDDQCPANASSNHDYGAPATFESVDCDNEQSSFSFDDDNFVSDIIPLVDYSFHAPIREVVAPTGTTDSCVSVLPFDRGPPHCIPTESYNKSSMLHDVSCNVVNKTIVETDNACEDEDFDGEISKDIDDQNADNTDLDNDNDSLPYHQMVHIQLDSYVDSSGNIHGNFDVLFDYNAVGHGESQDTLDYDEDVSAHANDDNDNDEYDDADHNNDDFDVAEYDNDVYDEDDNNTEDDANNLDNDDCDDDIYDDANDDDGYNEDEDMYG